MAFNYVMRKDNDTKETIINQTDKTVTFKADFK